MTSATQPATRSALRIIASWLIPVKSSFTAIGNVAYGVDTVLFGETTANVLDANQYDGMYLFRPDATAVGDRVRRISGGSGNSGNGLDLTNGRIYVNTDYTNAPASAENYEIHAIHPEETFRILRDDVLHNFSIPVMAPLMAFADADTQDSGTSSYSLSGAGAISKVSTAANVYNGRQSLFFNAGTAGEILSTPAVRVQAGQQYFASVIIRVDAGGPFYFGIYDSTNSNEIKDNGDTGTTDRLSTSHEGWMSLQRTFTPPTGCEEIVLRVIGTADSDDAYIQSFSGPFKATDRLFNLPSWVENSSDLLKILYADYQYQVSDGVFDATTRAHDEHERFYADYHVRINNDAAQTAKIEFARGSGLELREPWIEAQKPVDTHVTILFTAAGETSPTIPVDETHLALRWGMAICDWVLDSSPDDAQALRTQARIAQRLDGFTKEAKKDITTPSRPPAIPWSGGGV